MRANRLRILDAARADFCNRGFAAASMREIAAAAGVDVGLVTYYFGSKENLFLEAVETTWSPPAMTPLLTSPDARTRADVAARLGRHVCDPGERPALRCLLRTAVLPAPVPAAVETAVRAGITAGLDRLLADAGDDIALQCVAARVLGLIALRELSEFEPLVSASREAITAHLDGRLARALEWRVPPPGASAAAPAAGIGQAPSLLAAADPEAPPAPDPGAPCRDRILAAARAEFSRRGYAGTTLRHIASVADCEVALLAHHFGSKADLFFAAVVAGHPSRHLLRRLLADGVPDAVYRWALHVLVDWEVVPRSRAGRAALRSLTFGVGLRPDGAGLSPGNRAFLEVFEPVGDPELDFEWAALGAGVVGLHLTRSVLRLPAVREASLEELAGILAAEAQGLLDEEAARGLLPAPAPQVSG